MPPDLPTQVLLSLYLRVLSSHYVTAAFLIITRYKLLYTDWRGYLIAGFALVWVANVYMGLFGRIRLDLKRERAEISTDEAALLHTHQ